MLLSYLTSRRNITRSKWPQLTLWPPPSFHIRMERFLRLLKTPAFAIRLTTYKIKIWGKILSIRIFQILINKMYLIKIDLSWRGTLIGGRPRTATGWRSLQSRVAKCCFLQGFSEICKIITNLLSTSKSQTNSNRCNHTKLLSSRTVTFQRIEK
jgi:hypothetical protein